MLEKLWNVLNRKHETNSEKTVQIVEPIRKGCMRCRFVILRDNWHIQFNTCTLRHLTLGKDITKEDGCERFEGRGLS